MIRVLLTIDGAVGGEDPGSPARPALRRLCDDDDPAVALVACQFMSQALENAGDLAGAREMLERALALARPDDGPWARAQLHAMMAGLAGQSGQVDLAEEHAREALPVAQELGATEDSIQLHSTLVMAQLARGELDEAERSVAAAERLDRRRETVSWRLISALSRAELTLARGDAASGLALYREAVEANRESRRPWLSDVEEVAPWLLFTQSASLCAHVIHDESGQERTAAMAAELRAKVPVVLSARTLRLDFPVAGGVLFALGCWALAACRGEAGREAGVRLLLLARAFGYQQTMPSMRWQTGERLAERHAPGRLDALGTSYAGRAPYELCDEAAAVTARLAP